MNRVRFCLVLILCICFAHVQADEVLMVPNERVSFDDCHLRFPKFDGYFSERPVSGYPARLKEFAHMAAIGWTQSNGSVSWKCGGTLIWVNFVLTAAHCVADANSKNQAPDVVRLGDLNIQTSEGDEYAQQLNIVEIFKHPKHRFIAHYHDIALLKLEHDVILSEVVAPACLWTDEEMRFKILEATGWGRTGYANDFTPILMKVALKPIDNVKCSEVYLNGTDRMLRLGLQSHQICAVDVKMDTCEADSGGPLQIKLMHNARVTPFVVAITSFGKACGMSAPGVYTKVAPYHDWIVEVMQAQDARVPNDVFNATFCALRFPSHREFEDAIITDRSLDQIYVVKELRNIFVSKRLPSYIVQLAWNGETNSCYGVVIDEDTVVTLAQCILKNEMTVSHVIYSGNHTTRVSKVHVHPRISNRHVYGKTRQPSRKLLFSVQVGVTLTLG
ncbi:serine protease snake-like [Toxorhynchites rutilus septentrionalis]|uniref:serine protease snake-like n=1 Tax=Toxorhynchites rutilus septentrionalis TaxID=329112 RepID=UPI002478EB99|nr:serine protease snake-like [Toxorhynchites rutilus septentrionalis]